jgi:hypothetical protein
MSHFTNIRCCLTMFALPTIIALAPAAAKAQQSGQATAGRSTASLPATGVSSAAGRSTESPAVGPHGGQISNSNGYEFEAVYLPRETRVYMYDASHRPVASRALRGDVTMHVHGNSQVQRFELRPTSSSQDYLAAGIDVSRIPDGSMDASFVIAAANWPANQAIRFSQTFARTREPLTVTVATLTAADRAAIAAQGKCPVTGEELGSMGPPIKLLVGDKPLYVCCKGCVNKVKQTPELYLQKVSRPAASEAGARAQPPSAQSRVQSQQSITVTIAAHTEADGAAIAAQGTCPVSGAKLGSMGPPIKLLIGDTPLYVCCKGCIRKVQQKPQLYLQEISHRQSK